MKTKIYFFALLLLLQYTGFAQILTPQAAVPTDPVEANTLHAVFSNLEKDRIPNGLLLDAAVELINIEKI